MMPNTRVSPAASRNSSSPNCRPLRHCSMKSSMVAKLVGWISGRSPRDPPMLSYPSSSPAKVGDPVKHRPFKQNYRLWLLLDAPAFAGHDESESSDAMTM